MGFKLIPDNVRQEFTGNAAVPANEENQGTMHTNRMIERELKRPPTLGEELFGRRTIIIAPMLPQPNKYK